MFDEFFFTGACCQHPINRELYSVFLEKAAALSRPNRPENVPTVVQ